MGAWFSQPHVMNLVAFFIGPMFRNFRLTSGFYRPNGMTILNWDSMDWMVWWKMD